MSEIVQFKGEKVSIDSIINAINDLGSYPLFELTNKSFKMRVLPTFYDRCLNGDIIFSIDGGMEVVHINKEALILEVDPAKFPQGLLDHVKSVKTFFIQSHENEWLVAYFPKHFVSKK